ncbi:glycosyl transferase [Aspergillus heteromorphus CBS 117.55]|uniref:Glycosyl transferase n=1 Tax=Aspergillus heteromorphus CBS 117.55 TaxID=1448321 RepID=A0A317VJ62_9EURO|nr:glycosyl transferase [Aspergillus heteromorphus CBS 117.55]PWY73058.1 glycosyl transferase [Aspergillus heteromorphus CBS 117.55]
MIWRGLCRRPLLLAIAMVVCFTWLFYRSDTLGDEVSLLERHHPLLFRYVHTNSALGGAWYIPRDWLSDTDHHPGGIVDAAQLALRAARSSVERQIPHSSIPLIVHQTWKNTRIDTWPRPIRHSTERWLRMIDGKAAYILWDDDGVAQFIQRFESELEEQFFALSPVERADVFRVLVSKWIGGVYADMDTEPLRSPADWISHSDLLPWQDPEAGKMYNSPGPVNAILGVEADCPSNSDDYWRMGYLHPLQLTQWAFAWAPGHPILQTFVDRLTAQLRTIMDQNGGLQTMSARQALRSLDPIALTGPGAITQATQSWLETTADLRWTALSGLHDNGTSKLVDDVLILPITGFSPGRRGYGNMGSKPISDPSARLLHRAQGSWRAFDLRVEYGKFCRTMFGRCRHWSKVPHHR